MAKAYKKHFAAFKNEAEIADEFDDEGKTLEDAEDEYFED